MRHDRQYNHQHDHPSSSFPSHDDDDAMMSQAPKPVLKPVQIHI